MNDAVRTYFALLRNALWGTSENGVTDIADALPIAQRQGTGTLVAEQILKSASDKELRMVCKSICARSMMAQEEQRSVMRKAMKALSDAGISPVLLKGLGLAHYYPKPYLRSCGDVDIYVGKEQYHHGAKILRETFPDAPHFDTEEEYFKHYNLTIGNTAIEMHRVSAMFLHPKDAKIFDALERAGLQQDCVRVSDGEDMWNEPEWKFNVLFVFIHSWDHFVGESANMRQLCDLALLVNQGKEGLEPYLQQHLRQLHLYKAWQLYAYILVHYLGVPKEKCPLYTASCSARAELVLQQILSGYPQKEESQSQPPKNVLLRKLFTLRNRVRDARAFARFEPHYARHLVTIAFAQSWERFKKGENTRKWE